jgi:hypothetical protein
MNTIRNLRPHDKGIQYINLVQGMEGCPITDIIRALTVFDRSNSPNGKSPSAKRWIKQFAGLESIKSGKAMEPLIEIIFCDNKVQTAEQFDELLKEVMH